MDGFIGMNTGTALEIMGRIEQHRADMQGSMEAISKEVEALKDVWHGSRSENFYENATGLISNFHSFDEAIADAATEIKNTAAGYAYSDFMDIKLFTEQFEEQEQKIVSERKQKEQEIGQTLFVSKISENENMPTYLFMTTETQMSFEEQQTKDSNYQTSIDFLMMGLFLIIVAGIVMKKWFKRDRKKRRRQVHDYNINAIQQ